MNISGNTMNIDAITVDGKDLKTTIEPFTYNSAGAHNAIYRGKDLGTFSEAHSAAIRAGTFLDIYIGDYWDFSNIPYTYYGETSDTTAQAGKMYYADATGTALETQPETGADISGAGYFEKVDTTYSGRMYIADCNYFLWHGSNNQHILRTNHIVVVPASNLFQARMNPTDTTKGGYVLSEMRTVHLKRAEAIFKACFGESHALKHEEFLVNAVTDGKSSAGAWYDSYCELMDERMVYGSLIYDSGGNKSTANYTQLNLFRHNPRLILTNYMRYWMRNIASSSSFAAIRYNDLCYLSPASEIWGGVRPYALIY